MYQFAAATLLVALALAGVCHGAAAAPRPDWRDFACRTCDLPEMAGELILAGVRNSTLLPCDDPQVAHLAVSFQYTGVKNCGRDYWVLLEASCPPAAVTAASGGGADEAGADNNAQLLVASFQWVLEPYFCGWPKDEASHCSEYCSTRLNSLRDLPHPGPAVLHSVAPRDEQQQHPAPAPSPQIEVQPYLSKGTALPSPSECANIPDLSMLPAAAASLDPWAPACSGTQPPAYDLLNATLDVARELLFAENKTNSPACAGIILLGLELACAQTARSEEGAELGTVVHLLVGIDCFDKYGSEPCCASDFEGADMRATFFVPAGGSASEAEPVDIEVDRYWSAPWLTVGGPRRC